MTIHDASPIKILINGLKVKPRKAGVSIYFEQILQELCAQECKSQLWIVVVTKDYWDYLSEGLQKSLEESDHIKVLVLTSQSIIINSYRCWKASTECVLTIFPDYYPATICNGRYAVIVHDLHFRIFPATFRLHQKVFRHSIFLIYRLFSPTIFTISSRTSSEVSYFYPYLGKKLHLIGSGTRINSETGSPVKELAGKIYILAIGTTHTHKNYERLIAAYLQAAVGHRENHQCSNFPSLVIVGRPGNNHVKVQKAISEAQAQGHHVFWLTDLSSRQLVWAYQNCLGLILPSTYEGYGLPLAEGIALQRPIACSNIDAFREIGADSLTYFNPYNTDEISGSIAKLANQEIPLAPQNIRERVAFASVISSISDFLQKLPQNSPKE